MSNTEPSSFKCHFTYPASGTRTRYGQRWQDEALSQVGMESPGAQPLGSQHRCRGSSVDEHLLCPGGWARCFLSLAFITSTLGGSTSFIPIL